MIIPTDSLDLARVRTLPTAQRAGYLSGRTDHELARMMEETITQMDAAAEQARRTLVKHQSKPTPVDEVTPVLRQCRDTTTLAQQILTELTERLD